jgi:putative NADH-flavin reductase/pimeloyl-ACP methyl ester carboxylesterase
MSTVPGTTHRFVEVDGVRVFYRETGPAGAPTMLLLHGFPSASHQFSRLMDVLGANYRLIAPDYPGFGYTETPEGFVYSFEALAHIVEGFVRKIGLQRFVLYAFDFGGPVGFRLATRHPEWIAGLVIQNANVYEEGLSEMAREMIANRPGADSGKERVLELLTLPVTRSQYESGASDSTLIAPDGWTLDQHFLDLPGRKEAQIDLAMDYFSNVACYPAWQRYLRTSQPPTLIVWGRNDAFFTEPGAHAYLHDLPDAELHLLNTGHFALEEKLSEVVPHIADFLDHVWKEPMKIAVIGATGNLGSAVVAEASSRGHRVTALNRSTLDVTDSVSIKDAVSGHDAVVVAVKGPDRVVPRSVHALLDAMPAAGVNRLIFLGGGGSLEYAPGQQFVDSRDFPPQYLETARDQAEALAILRRADTTVEWSYASPPPVYLTPGERTGTYRSEARDTPITNENGESRITVGDYASAVVDALESGTFVRQRFTTAY